MSQVPLAAQRHRHGPHHRALSRPGAVYQPRADVAGLAELTCGSDEASKDGKADNRTDRYASSSSGHRSDDPSMAICHGANDGDRPRRSVLCSHLAASQTALPLKPTGRGSPWLIPTGWGLAYLAVPRPYLALRRFDRNPLR
jgi:hypothetical protein